MVKNIKYLYFEDIIYYTEGKHEQGFLVSVYFLSFTYLTFNSQVLMNADQEIILETVTQFHKTMCSTMARKIKFQCRKYNSLYCKK